MTQNTADRRKEVAKSGYYDIYIEIDCDCEELVDACGLEYEEVADDSTQNEICISLDSDEYGELVHDVNFAYTDEQDIALNLLNAELSEYVTKVTIYKPSGDIISFS
tara:strand:- start:409 stop:729 length:321 start_codon:yes stop_codon:yes gene_type:complete